MNIAATVTSDTLVCGSSPADGGVWNTATITNGIAYDDSSDCIVIERPTVDIAKTVTETKQLEDGTWEITYEVVVTHTGGPDSALYNLSDALMFGGDITVDDASWSGPTGSGTFAADGTATLATNRVLLPLGRTPTRSPRTRQSTRRPGQATRSHAPTAIVPRPAVS